MNDLKLNSKKSLMDFEKLATFQMVSPTCQSPKDFSFMKNLSSFWYGRKALLWIKARALSHQTGLISVSDYNTRTNMVGIGKKYMPALYPTKTGNMVMHVNKTCNQQPVMTLPSVNMTHEYIPVTFLLSRFLGHNKLVNLDWKEGFTLQGTQRRLHHLKMS
jgi:hypothetical protein